MQGIGTLSAFAVSPGEREALVAEVARQLGRVLEGESHERTTCLALDNLQRWLVHAHAPLPSHILDLCKVTAETHARAPSPVLPITSRLDTAL